jgi:polyisoprenoid-binding protein YceI
MTVPEGTSVDLPTLVRDGSGAWTLDPAGSSVEFHVKHFWGLMTVHGRFDSLSGEGQVDAAGTVSGQIRIGADSVNTKNKKRDQHLRSDDFFDAEHHATVTIEAAGLTPAEGGELRGSVTFDAAGYKQPLDAVIRVVDASADAVTLQAEAEVERAAFGMTWGPLHMTAPTAHAVVTARFVRG